MVKVGEAPQAAGPGALTFVIGTANELRDRVDGLPGEAATRPWIGFAVDRRLGTAVLVASGPSQAEVESAVEALAGPSRAARRRAAHGGRHDHLGGRPTRR